MRATFANATLFHNKALKTGCVVLFNPLTGKPIAVKGFDFYELLDFRE
jgi:hypothetical protein